MKARMVRRLRAVACAVLSVQSAWSADAGNSAERRNWFETPFDQAVAGMPGCPRPEGPLITQAEMRQQAHGRIERGTSCWLAKKCEDSNVYRRDPEIQQRVLHAIRGDGRFAQSSLWVTTERRYVTLQGCAVSVEVKSSLLAQVRAVEGVEQVFDQLIVGATGRPRWRVAPASPGR
jgi:hypothetical protein